MAIKVKVYPIKDRTYWWRTEVEREDLSGWLGPWKRLIQTGRRIIITVNDYSYNFVKWLRISQ